MSEQTKPANTPGKALLSNALTIGAAFLIALAIVQVVRPVIVRGESMEETFHNRDYLLVYRLAYHKGLPEHGDIVVVYSEDEDELMIKRVIGLPGDTLRFADNGVYRNGTLLQEDYIDQPTDPGAETTIEVPADHIFVMGDNRGNSLDSRDLGPFSASNIYGKVVVRLLPHPASFR